MHRPRSSSITIAALLMIAFGFAEIITGFSHNYSGLRLAEGAISTGVAACIGAFYAAAGLVTLTMKRRLVPVVLLLLAMVVAGRLFMIAKGLYPFNTLKQTAAMIAGTAIASGFAVFITLKRSAFR